MSTDIDLNDDIDINFDEEPPVLDVLDEDTAVANAALVSAAKLGSGETVDFEEEVTTLKRKGDSENVRDLHREERETRHRELVDDAKAIAGDDDIPDDEKRGFLTDIQQVIQNDGPRSTTEVAAKRIASTPAFVNQEDVQRTGEVSSRLYASSVLPDQFQEDIAKALFSKFGDETYEWYEAMYEGGEMVAPFEFGDKIGDWYEQWTGKSAGIFKRLLPGEAISEMKRELAAQTNPQAKRAMFNGMLDALKNVDGLWAADSSKMGFVFLANMVADPNFLPDEDFDWDRLIENAANLLDITVVGGSMLRTARNPFRATGLLQSVNKGLADQVYQKVLRSRRYREAGIDPVEISLRSHTTSARNGEALDDIPTEILHEIDKTEGLLKGIVHRANNMYKEYKANRSITIQNRINSYGFGEIHIPRTVARTLRGKKALTAIKDSQGNRHNTEITVFLGKDRLNGFDNYDQLLEYARANKVELGNFDIVKRSLGKYSKLAKERVKGNKWRYPTEKGEDGVRYIKGLEEGDEIFLRFRKTEYVPDEKSILNFKGMNPSTLLGGLGKASKSRNIWDLYSLFGKEDALKLGATSDIQDSFTEVIRRANQHYNGLTVKGRNNVLRYLREISLDDTKKFTYDDLAVEGLPGMRPMSDQEYVALRNIQLTSDIQHHVSDTRLARQLKEMGMRQLHTADGTQIYGRKINPSTPAYADFKTVKEVSDLTTGRPMVVTKDMRDQIRNGKLELYKIRGKESSVEQMQVGKGDNAYLTDSLHKNNYVIVDNQSISRVNEVPDAGVLPYVPNYVYRDYEGVWFIEKIDKRTMVDGKPVRVGNVSKGDYSQDAATVVAAAERRSDVKGKMNELARQLSEEEAEHIEFVYRQGREMMETAGDNAVFEMAKQSGLLNKGKRGPMLDSVMRRSDSLIPVATSIQRSFGRLARELATEDMVQMAKDAFVRKYGKDGENLLPVKDPRLPQVFPSELPRGANPKASKTYDDMQVAWEYIDFLSGTQRGWYRPAIKKLNFKFADWLDSKGVQSNLPYIAGDVLEKGADLGWLRNLPFLSAIVGNPLRQFLMQASQHSALWALDPKFFAKGTAYQEAHRIMAGVAKRHDENWYKIAEKLKRNDQTVEEYTDSIDDVLDSGLFESINSHHYIEGASMMRWGLEGNARLGWETAAGVAEFIKDGVQLVKKVGFDKGEIFNLAVTRALAEHTLRKGGKTPTREAINELSRGWALGMNKSAKYAHQDTAGLQLFTQFFSFQQKSLALLWRGFSKSGKGNQLFTPSQARRIAGVQIVNFGSYGVGMSWLANGIWDKYEETFGTTAPETLRHASVYGATNYAMNLALQAAYGEHDIPRLNFGSTFAPFSGYTFIAESMYDALMSTDEPSILALAGASGMYLRKVDKSVDKMFTAFAVVDTNDPIAVENVQIEALKTVSSLLSSGMSNFWKVELVKGIHYLKDTSGNKQLQLMASEVIAKKFLGVEVMSHHYEVSQDIKKVQKEAWKEGNRIANAFISIAPDEESYIETLGKAMQYVMLIDDPFKRSLIRQSVVKNLSLHMTEGNTVARKLILDIIEGGIGSKDVLSSKLKALASNAQEEEAIEYFIEQMFKQPEGYSPIIEAGDEE